MKCPECGTELTEGQKICGTCGYQIAPEIKDETKEEPKIEKDPNANADTGSPSNPFSDFTMPQNRQDKKDEPKPEEGGFFKRLLDAFK